MVSVRGGIKHLTRVNEGSLICSEGMKNVTSGGSEKKRYGKI